MARAAVPAEYLALNKYLTERFADSVVLRFGEIEDLIGIALPVGARHEATWWALPETSSSPSPQSSAWSQADRTAVPNFRAQTVTFERRLR